MSDVMLDGLGSAVATNKCYDSASRAQIFAPSAGRTVVLSEELDSLGQQTELLETIESRLKYAVTGSKALKFGAQLVRRL
jgi:hypothetical protein